MTATRSFPRLARALLTATAGLAALAPAAARAADAAHPAVVELFQSQGCSDCPPANANLLKLIGRPDVLALSWQVTYWDNLGWKDTFGDQAYTDRQWQYAHHFHRGEVATPEVVVNGRADVVGGRPGEIEALIRREDRGAGGPQLTLTGDRVTVAGGGAHGVVTLVRYDPNVVEVPIRRGENGGQTLPHRDVVREVAVLGALNGGVQSFALPAARRAGLKTAVLVQAGPGGAILAAARS